MNTPTVTNPLTCLRVVGSSMTAPKGSRYSFPDGTLLYVRPAQDWTPGKFVIVQRAGKPRKTFRRLTALDGELFLEALNPEHPDRCMKLQPDDTLCGVVVQAGFDLP